MDILILITGGTLDKVHDTLTEGLVFDESGDSHIPDVLRIGRCQHPVQNILMQKDSLDMNDQDRALILKAPYRDYTRHRYHGTNGKIP